MKRRLFFFFSVLAGLLISLTPIKSFATHAQGVDLRYEWISGNTFNFVLTFYRDCAGVAAPAGATLSYFSPTSCGPPGSITLTLSGAGVEVSPLCPAQLSNSACNGGGLPGVEQYTYTGQVTFPNQCTDWTISWDHCCRNAAITNLNGPTGQSIYIQTTLNNTGTLFNSSPVFTSLPVPYICANQNFCYNHGAIDPDGDSLVYSLVNALTTGAANIPYNGGYSPTYPITDVSGSIVFDPNTGSMCVTPNGPQVCVVTIQVDEYRNGVVIGTSMRDLQIVVQNCTNVQPIDSSNGMTNIVGGVSVDTNRVEICPNTLLTFQMIFSDPNPGDVITATSNIASAIPGASLNFSGTNPVTASFSWTPTSGDVGTHQFNITIQDDGCPILGSQVYSFIVDVLPRTTAGPDRAYCGVGPVQLNATGGTTFTWNVLSGDGGSLSCTNCQNPQSTPAIPTTYEVVSNLGGGCINRDTVFVDIVPGFTLSMPNDTSICRNGALFLTAGVNPSAAGYTYSWSPTTTLTSSTASNPIANPSTTTRYYLTVTNSSGCEISDSVLVTVSGVAPLVDAGPNVAVCPGTSTQLSTLITQECGAANYACSSVQDTVQIGSGASFSSNYGPLILDGAGRSNRAQYILTRAELNAQGWVTGARIDGIGVNVGTAGTGVSNFTVKMGCTSLTTFPTGTFVDFGMLQVKNPFNYNPAAGWNYITFDTPYYWDGQSNVIVEFCHDALTSGTSTLLEYTCNLGVFFTIRLSSASANACTQASGTRLACKPNMRFIKCDADPASLTYNWAPGTSLDNTASPTPNASPTATTTYLVGVSDGSCTGNDWVTVAIDSTIFVNATASDPTPCPGDTVTLTANTTGSPVPITIPCGANGSTCTGTQHSELVGSGFSYSENYSPFFATLANDRYANRVQFIFTAQELIANGMSFSGTITELSLNLSGFEDDWSYTEIKMGCTNQSEYATNNFINGLSTVYLNTATHNWVSGWNTWVLQNTFDWDGSSNIVVEFCTRVRGGSTRYMQVLHSSTSPVFRGLYRNELCNCSACGLGTGTPQVFRPNVIFTICDAPLGTLVYTWSPTTDLTSTNTPVTDAEDVNAGITYTVTVTGGWCDVSDTVNLTMCGPLPVDDLNLFGRQAGADLLLNWEAKSEAGSHYYQLFHSKDGQNFRVIDTQESHQKTSGTSRYSSLHVRPPSGINYYKVKQVNLDGSSGESQTVALEIESPAGLVNFYPNPVSGGADLNFEYLSLSPANLEIRVMDMMGKLIKTGRYDLAPGSNAYKFSFDSVPQGTYFVEFRSGTESDVVKVVVAE